MRKKTKNNLVQQSKKRRDGVRWPARHLSLRSEFKTTTCSRAPTHLASKVPSGHVPLWDVSRARSLIAGAGPSAWSRLVSPCTIMPSYLCLPQAGSLDCLPRHLAPHHHRNKLS
ncbi:hypothetical protein PoB_007410200 [Plakobranchus ocellatus]|uniref:Uncharacterized protein n=1 Tax=Plakobranchus ocellatus TaxID=259542 RepID=A0AAV4DTE6_9GAST|nr:hypothetical protein PoB_007410200 [Plakobranchus ocellatus]